MKEADLVVFPLRDGERWTASLPHKGEYHSLARKCRRPQQNFAIALCLLSLSYLSSAKFYFPLIQYSALGCVCTFVVLYALSLPTGCLLDAGE